MKTLSQDAVRGVMIAAQGLQGDPQPPATKDDVLAMVRQLHRLQIDSISVVARAHYFVLWSRLGDYDPNWLDEWLEEGKLFEYWSGGNCFLPIEDFNLYRAGNRLIDWKNPQKWLDEHPEITAKVLTYIRLHGATQHTEFGSNDTSKPVWFTAKDEQIALEYLVYTFELMVRKRENLHRYYDLRERIYPDADKLPPVTFEEANDAFVLKTIRALGVAKTEWIANYFRFKQAWVNASLKRLEKQDRVLKVEVEGWKKAGYVHPDNLKRVEAAADGNIPRSKTTLLSPFDPLVGSRSRANELFNFDFPIEFYFPEAKRIYGYYSLPILHNNALIGRLDPKANRKEGIFEVKSLHLEAGVVIDDALVVRLKKLLRDCAMWHETPQVIVNQASDPELTDLLSS